MPYMHAGSTNLYYQVSGSGPALLLLHGFACGESMWQHLKPGFSHDYQVISVDLRGHGRTLCRTAFASYSEKMMTEDVINLISNLSLREINLVGFSMGARIASLAVAKKPELFRTLVLTSIGSGSDNPEASAERAKGWIEVFEREGSDAFIKAISAGSFFKRYIASGTMAKRHMQTLMRAQETAELVRVLKFNLLQRPTIYESEALFRRIDIPTLILVGEKDKDCLNVSKFLQGVILKSQLSALIDTGHMIPLENPDLFSDLVTTFLTDAGAQQ